MNKNLFKIFVVVSIFLSFSALSATNSKIRVVTSFTILEDLVSKLGGRYVDVKNLVARNSDAHMYIPVPSDSVAVVNADLVIFNGLGFEGWINRLLNESSGSVKHLDASRGVRTLESSGEVDPHAWQSFDNIRIYINNISETLISMMPENKQYFIDRKMIYLNRLDDLNKKLSFELSKIPISHRIVVTSHDAFAYLGREFQIEFLAPLGLSLDVEASAEDIAYVIDQIRERNVRALFIENINNPKLLQMISLESDIVVGGRIYSDALSEIEGPASTYLKMMEHNLMSLIEAFDLKESEV